MNQPFDKQEMADKHFLSKYEIIHLIPQDMVNMLLNFRELSERSSWGIGDLTNELQNYLSANGYEVFKAQIYLAVGQITGKSSRSVRMYSTVAGFFPQEVRDKFSVLPFSHFAFAIRFKNGEIDGIPLWQGILEHSYSQFENTGLPPSVESLGFSFENEIRPMISDNEHAIDQINPYLPGREADIDKDLEDVISGNVYQPEMQLRNLYAAFAHCVKRANGLLSQITDIEMTMGHPDPIYKRASVALINVSKISEEMESRNGDIRQIYNQSVDRI